jgi:formylglycine-generating enzyme required for sulfatase activity
VLCGIEAEYQAANNPARPLDALSPSALNTELVNIARKIQDAATRPISLRPESPPASVSHQTLGEPLRPKQPFEPKLILIPAGEFLMGSDPQQDEDAGDEEQPQHLLSLPDYYLAKTPVTNAQYRAFVLATGHEEPEGWTNRTPPRGEEDHPVVHVSWYDARDYCLWLSEVTGRGYGLPSEAEWEKGARGTDGRIHLWGDRWDATRCKSGEGDLAETTSVHAYPQGASPYGVLDMTGNVWEWTRSLWGRGENPDYRYPYRANDGRENLAAGQKIVRVLRGGAFFDDGSGRCAFRTGPEPYREDEDIGFRVVVRPSS